MRRGEMVLGCVLMGLVLAAFVAPAWAAAAPDAEGWISLFNGKDLEGWQNARQPGAETKWTVEDGTMTNVEHGLDIAAKDSFKDFDLKIEFKTVPKGNSGIYLRGRIEIQVLDSFDNKGTPGKGDCGAIYDQYAPSENACKPAGEWNTVEATYVGDTVSVKLNGKQVINKVKITKPTGAALPGDVNEAGPLYLQGNHGKVWFRNIKIRPLK